MDNAIRCGSIVIVSASKSQIFTVMTLSMYHHPDHPVASWCYVSDSMGRRSSLLLTVCASSVLLVCFLCASSVPLVLSSFPLASHSPPFIAVRFPLSGDILQAHEDIEELVESHLIDCNSLVQEMTYLLVTITNAEDLVRACWC